MTRNCLIGYTGFVGGQLAGQSTFSAVFNSANIAELAQQEFDTLVCAAAPGSMFEANKFPDRDQAKIQALIDELSKVRTSRFILISSIAVLEDFAGGDDEGTTAFQEELAYGRHRRALEAFVEETFEESLVARLPALFGQGLRKNFIFDLLNPIPTFLTEAKRARLPVILDRQLCEQLTGLYAPDPATGMLKLDRAALDADPARAALDEAVITHGFSATQFHNPETTYQYYNMNRLWSDIDVALQAGLSHIHLVSEPLKAARIHYRLTGRDMPESDARQHHEDMRTRHAELWGKQSPYLEEGDTVLDQLAAFYASERRVP
jgi:hypothetical protein